MKTDTNLAWAGLWAALSLSVGPVRAAEKPAEYEGRIRPLMVRYCLDCHSTEKQKGDLDLERFGTMGEVLKHADVWQNVAEQVSNNEMPPKDKPQPSAEERAQLVAWANAVLDQIGLSQAGDPGPVVLRRLSNAEYTYTIRDLTGVEGLDPAREFPIDGAAGEGFMNTGSALVMSPSLFTKYLDAGKEIASHAVLLPDGIRFSPATTRRDWTEEILGQIREFYSRYTDPSGGEKVNLQGIVFETNGGGRLPVEKYLAATLVLSQRTGHPTIEQIQALAMEQGLSAKYLQILWATLAASEPSLVLDPIRARWRAAGKNDVPVLAREIAAWQQALWKFSTVGHIGKAGGPKGWLEPIDPLMSAQEIRLKMPSTNAQEVTLYLVAGDASDGNEHDYVVWKEPHFVMPGRPKLMLRDVRSVVGEMTQRRERVYASAQKALAAAAEASGVQADFDPAELAKKHGIEVEILMGWLDYLAISPSAPVKIEGYLTERIQSVAGYDFIRGWGSANTPNLVANSSDQAVRIPGNMKPRGVAMHPSPKLQVAAGWQSPIAGTVRVAARMKHAHPECGNGVTWTLEWRSGSARRRLASGVAQGSKEVEGGIEQLMVRPGDMVALLVGPRNGNHSCDLTAVDLAVTQSGDAGVVWDLAKEITSDVLAGNPHADRQGNAGVWHFFTEPDKGMAEPEMVIPEGSLLARWQSAADLTEKRDLAGAVQRLLTEGGKVPADSPDGRLFRQLSSLSGPLLAGGLERGRIQAAVDGAGDKTTAGGKGTNDYWALDPGQFGRMPGGTEMERANLGVRAPAVVEVRLPADLVAGWEFVTTGLLHAELGKEGSVQLQVRTTKPEGQSGLLPTRATVSSTSGPWTSDNRRIVHGTPVVVHDGTAARKRLENAFDDFRRTFPAALCYRQIVPVDEVVTLTLYYREDDHLARLMLSDAEKANLDRLWAALHFVSHDAVTLVDAFEQLWQYATQDADPKVFEPLRKPIQDRAAAFKQRLVETEPRHMEAVIALAERAYRRPVTEAEREELRRLYRLLRENELPHEQAIRLTLARIFVAPAFLYRLEKPGTGSVASAVSDWELASRLSYFLWSSMPDAELLEAARSGRLREPEVLAAQARRMLADSKVRRMAIEFGCQWLNIHGFDQLDEKSERHFPTFKELRGLMYEESIQFFTHLIRQNKSMLEILDADYTFLNGRLAEHYGIAGVAGEHWRRVDGVKKAGRGGILGHATTLAKQSGASRTSPILRGNWVAEALLGDRLPRPPKDVPQLPEEETATEGLTVRQLVEKHSRDPRCYGCHARIDPFGYALEAFDAIGRRREKDLAGRSVDVKATVMDGAAIEDIGGLRDYLLNQRRATFVHQFCRKMLGYALGRAVQVSDRPLLAEMEAALKNNGYPIRTAVEFIVRSPQFRNIRGREAQVAAAD